MLREKITYGLIDLAGGEKENVIPSECHASLIINPRNLDALLQTASEFNNALCSEYGTTDPGVKLTLDYEDDEEETELILTTFSLDKILTIFNLMPNGIYSMSADLPGLVETSCSMGVACIENEMFRFRISIRSSLTSGKEMLSQRRLVMHKLWFYNKLMEDIRTALDEGRFAEFKKEKEEIYGRRI